MWMGWVLAVIGWLDHPVDDWQLVAPTEARASVEMPAEPTAASRTMMPAPGQRVDVHLFVYQDEMGTNFVFGYHDQVDTPQDAAEIKRILDGGVRGAVARTLGELESAQALRVARHPAREFTFKCVQGESTDEAQPLRCRGRIILVGKRMYQLMYVAHEGRFDAEEADQFLKSFKLVSGGP